MSAQIIAHKGALIDAVSVERMRSRSLLLTVGALQGALMLRAHNSSGRLSVNNRRERYAAERLVERRLLKHWPIDAYVLTERGKCVWLLVRGERS